MKRPLASLALAYAGGLLLAQLLHPPLPALFAAAGLALILLLVVEKLRAWLLLPLLALIGWTNFAARTGVVSPNDLRSQIGSTAALVSVRGTLLETPSLRIFLRDEALVKRSAARLRVSEWRRDASWLPAVGDIVVTTPEELPAEFFSGQPVEISGVLARPALPVAPGIFDYRAHLENLGIYYALKTDGTNAWQLGEKAQATPPFATRFIAWASRTLTRGLDPADEATQLLLAMTLGQKAALNDEVREPFMRSGTMHIFAISGLHIALIASLLLAILRVARAPRAACGLIVLPLLWFYTAATGWQPSAIRATIMMSVIIAGWSLKRPSDPLNSLAAAGLIILVWDPQQLFQASFQLSFFVVLSLALFSPPLEKIRDRWLAIDPLLPAELLPRWRRWLNEVLRVIAAGLTTSLAAWLGSLPLTTYYFHLFNPVTLLANLLIVPLAGLTLAANLASLVCGDWLAWPGELFNHAAWLGMHLMVSLSDRCTQIPGAWMNVPAPPPALIALYFALLIGTTSGWLFAPARRQASIATLVLLTMVGVHRWQSHRDETGLTLLPLNGGHAVFVDAAGRKNDWLINCGSENAVRFMLKDFLRAQGVNRIPRLVLTEGDVKNCGGARRLDELFGVDELWTSRVKFRSAAYRDAVARLEQNPARHHFLSAGETNGVWEILFPPAEEIAAKADDRPLVLRGDFHGTKILLLSDLSRAGQSALLAAAQNLHADIVIAGLPQTGEPLNDTLIAAIEPRVIVIADSEQPATRRAGRALKARLAATKMPVLYTRTAGAVNIVVSPAGWQLHTLEGQEFFGLVTSK
jgi:ComEC/Rec2-related protein